MKDRFESDEEEAGAVLKEPERTTNVLAAIVRIVGMRSDGANHTQQQFRQARTHNIKVKLDRHTLWNRAMRYIPVHTYNYLLVKQTYGKRASKIWLYI